MAYGSVRNSAGNFVKADLATVTDAAAGAAKNMPADFRVSITNAPGKTPIRFPSFTWMLIPSKIPDAGKAKTVRDFLKWMLTTGQQQASAMSYAPLPKEVVAMELKQIDMIQ